MCSFEHSQTDATHTDRQRCSTYGTNSKGEHRAYKQQHAYPHRHAHPPRHGASDEQAYSQRQPSGDEQEARSRNQRQRVRGNDDGMHSRS